MSAASLVENLVAFLLQSSAFLGVGLLLPRLFRVTEPKLQLGYGHGLLAISLALPFVGGWTRMAGPAAGAAITGAIAGGMEMVIKPGPRPYSPWPWLLGLLAAVCVARMIWLLFGLVALGRLKRTSQRLDPLPRPFAEASSRLDVTADFRVSGSVFTPLTFGVRRPVVLLPESARAMTPEAQRCIALHELLHVKRRDWPVSLIEEAFRSLLWFHPVLLLFLDRIALSREQVVDREVVGLTSDRSTYMHTLAAMARARRGAAAVAILPFFHRSHLLQRLALLTQEVSMSKLKLVFTLTGVITVLLFAGVIATRAFPLLGHPGDISALAAGAQVGSPPVSQPAEPKVYEMGTKGIVEPKLIKKVEFVRPAEAQPDNIEVIVVLGLVINEKGVPTQIEVLKSGSELLSAATVEAVSQWRWEPAKLDGKPVSVRWTFTARWGVV